MTLPKRESDDLVILQKCLWSYSFNNTYLAVRVLRLPINTKKYGSHGPSIWMRPELNRHGSHRYSAPSATSDGGQLHGTLGQRHPALGVVDGQLPQHEGFRRLGPFGRFPLAQGRLDPRHKLRRREGLDHVVVGSLLAYS